MITRMSTIDRPPWRKSMDGRVQSGSKIIILAGNLVLLKREKGKLADLIGGKSEKLSSRMETPMETAIREWNEEMPGNSNIIKYIKDFNSFNSDYDDNGVPSTTTVYIMKSDSSKKCLLSMSDDLELHRLSDLCNMSYCNEMYIAKCTSRMCSDFINGEAYDRVHSSTQYINELLMNKGGKSWYKLVHGKYIILYDYYNIKTDNDELKRIGAFFDYKFNPSAIVVSIECFNAVMRYATNNWDKIQLIDTTYRESSKNEVSMFEH